MSSNISSMNTPRNLASVGYNAVLNATRTPEMSCLRPAPYIVIDTSVAAGSPELLQALSVLEQLSIMVRATRQGSAEYDGDSLFPLEGVWDLVESDKALTFDERVTPGKIMMCQASSLTIAEFDEHRQRLSTTIQTSQLLYLNAARLVTIDEGLCVQILHLGQYNDEPASFAILNRFLQAHQLRRVSASTHREIYLVDARTAQSAAYKTVLRLQVENI